jgi:hypothetical protein
VVAVTSPILAPTLRQQMRWPWRRRPRSRSERWPGEQFPRRPCRLLGLLQAFDGFPSGSPLLERRLGGPAPQAALRGNRSSYLRPAPCTHAWPSQCQDLPSWLRISDRPFPAAPKYAAPDTRTFL